MADSYLEHHGIKGMKWGVRNEETRKRYANLKGKLTSQNGNKVYQEMNVKRSRKKAMQNRRLMSDAELKKHVERLQNEKKLKDLTEADLHAGRTRVAKVAGATIGVAGTAAGVATAKYLLGTAAQGGKPNLKEAGQFVGTNLLKVKK